MRILALSLSFLSLPAFAAVERPSIQEPSRGLQMARRVATMEKFANAPARALYWSTRVSRNSKAIAFTESQTKPAKTKKQQ